jgi:hypothetical protein
MPYTATRRSVTALLLALLLVVVLASAGARAAVPSSSQASQAGPQASQAYRWRGTVWWNLPDSVRIGIMVNIHDFYGWKQALIRGEGSNIYLWSIYALRLYRDGVNVRAIGYRDALGPASFATDWDKTCGCNHVWFSQAYSVYVETNRGNYYKDTFTSGYYAT